MQSAREMYFHSALSKLNYVRTSRWAFLHLLFFKMGIFKQILRNWAIAYRMNGNLNKSTYTNNVLLITSGMVSKILISTLLISEEAFPIWSTCRWFFNPLTTVHFTLDKADSHTLDHEDMCYNCGRVLQSPCTKGLSLTAIQLRSVHISQKGGQRYWHGNRKCNRCIYCSDVRSKPLKLLCAYTTKIWFLLSRSTAYDMILLLELQNASF